MSSENRNHWERQQGVFIIAEAGVNHNGEIDMAKQLCTAAKEAGCDAVKFQTWKPGEVTGRYAIKTDYLESSSERESRYELSQRLCLPYDAFREIEGHCKSIDMLFLSTPDGFESLDFLVDQLRMPIVKVSSTEITHLQYIKAIAQKRLPTILSTGMSSLGEVERCVDIFRVAGHNDLSLLHCTSEYPAPPAEVNLRAMVTMRDAFSLPVGLSDHSVGSEAAIAAVALGASIIEKHFTLDREMEGPDHKASLDADDLKAFVESIRRTETMLGDGIKRAAPSEQKNISSIRRGVVARMPLKKGAVLTPEMLVAKRPYVGVEPGHADIMCGFCLSRDIDADEPIRWDDLE